MQDDNAVFVVGSARSGTSLMRSLLDGLPELAVAPETHFLSRWAPRSRDWDLDDPEVFDRFWDEFASSEHFLRLGLDPGVARTRILESGRVDHASIFRSLLRQYADRTGKPRCGEKTPGHWRHLETLHRWFPDARVVFMVRDPRGVVASHAVLRDLGVFWSQGGTYDYACGWRDAVEESRRWSRTDSVRVVQYEDLVRDPATTLSELCGFLGTPFSSSAIESRTPEGSADGRHDLPDADAAYLNPRSQVTSRHADRWKDTLDARDVALIEHVCRSGMRQYGYDAVAGGLTPTQRLAIGRTKLTNKVRGASNRLRRLARTARGITSP